MFIYRIKLIKKTYISMVFSEGSARLRAGTGKTSSVEHWFG